MTVIGFLKLQNKVQKKQHPMNAVFLYWYRLGESNP